MYYLKLGLKWVFNSRTCYPDVRYKQMKSRILFVPADPLRKCAFGAFNNQENIDLKLYPVFQTASMRNLGLQMINRSLPMRH